MTVATIPLRHAAEVLVSNVDKKAVDGDLPVRLVNYTDVYYQTEITSDLDLMAATATAEQLQKFRVQSGDSIITKDSESPDDIAVPAFVRQADEDMVCGYHLALLRPLDEIHPKYLYWALTSDFLREQFSVRANGMTRYGLTYDAIQGVEVPLPDLDRQRRVANFLDDQVARLDSLRNARQQQEELLGHEASAQLEALLGRPDTRPLDTVVDPRRPIQYGIVLPGPDYPGGVPIIKGGDVAANRMSLEMLNRTEPTIEARYPRSRLIGGDLVMAIRGSVGEIARVPNELAGANLTQDTARIAAHGADPVWLEHVLQIASVQSDIRSRITGASIPVLLTFLWAG
ncbi:MAG: restriction endonuclease subunit S [Candidatus Nanopelagicales bacterium]